MDNNTELDIENDDLKQEILFDILSKEIDNELKNKTPNKKNDKKKKRKKIISRLKSTLTVKTVLILLLTLIVNTYAWFIYISTVSTGLSMHVRNWEFEIVNDDEEFTLKNYMYIEKQETTIIFHSKLSALSCIFLPVSCRLHS